MSDYTWTLRVCAPSRAAIRVSTRIHQFTVGRPIEFDAESPSIGALEYALGAVGGEIVGGLLAFAKRRRLKVYEVEAVVTGALEGALAYLEVVGESGPPRIAGIHVKVFVATSEAEPLIRRAFAEAVARLPLVNTLRAGTLLDISLSITE
jgi:hypothetical protein